MKKVLSVMVLVFCFFPCGCSQSGGGGSESKIPEDISGIYDRMTPDEKSTYGVSPSPIKKLSDNEVLIVSSDYSVWPDTTASYNPETGELFYTLGDVENKTGIYGSYSMKFTYEKNTIVARGISRMNYPPDGAHPNGSTHEDNVVLIKIKDIED